MALESTLDLAGYFDTESHGISAVININGSNSTINVILNKDFYSIDPGTGIEIEGTQPVATGRTSDMTSVDNADTITIDSIQYSIIGVQPDGTGVTSLVLEAP